MAIIVFPINMGLLLVCTCMLLTTPAIASPFPEMPAHPRIRLTDAELVEVKRSITENKGAKDLLKALTEYADTMMSLPMVDCVPSGSNGALLSSSRTVLDRVYTLALSYRLTGDEKYANRTVVELMYVSSASNCPQGWSPPNFLAVAEMTHAVSVGYDWLFHYLTTPQRRVIEEALLRNGLNVGAHSFATQEWWSHFDDNWNIVCNVGLAYGVVAVADVYKEQAVAVWNNLTTSIHHGLGVYAPEGAWTEGPMYWGYAAEYALSGTGLVHALPRLNVTWASTSGFGGAGEFEIHLVGPTGNMFNWGDAPNTNISILADDMVVAAFLPLARDAVDATDTQRKAYAYVGREWVKARADCSGMVCAFALIAFSELGSLQDLEALPTAKVYKSRNVGIFRSAWGPPPFNNNNNDNNNNINNDNNNNNSTNKSATIININIHINTTHTDNHTDNHTNNHTDNKNTNTNKRKNMTANTSSPAWLAFKGNNGSWTHNDLDGGQWVLEMGGVAWAMDLGADNYGLPGYWTQRSGTNERYAWYRKSTHGHNTLTFGGWDEAPSGTGALGKSNQAFDGVSSISLFHAPTLTPNTHTHTRTRSRTTPASDQNQNQDEHQHQHQQQQQQQQHHHHHYHDQDHYAIVELGGVYGAQGAASVRRGFAFINNFTRVLIVDEFDFERSPNVTWAVHTTAELDVLAPSPSRGARATMKKQGRQLYIDVLESPAGGSTAFSKRAVNLVAPQESSEGVNKLLLTSTVAKGRFVVSLTLDDVQPPVSVRPLSEWATQGPIKT